MYTFKGIRMIFDYFQCNLTIENGSRTGVIMVGIFDESTW